MNRFQITFRHGEAPYTFGEGGIPGACELSIVQTFRQAGEWVVRDVLFVSGQCSIPDQQDNSMQSWPGTANEAAGMIKTFYETHEGRQTLADETKRYLTPYVLPAPAETLDEAVVGEQLDGTLPLPGILNKVVALPPSDSTE